MGDIAVSKKKSLLVVLLFKEGTYILVIRFWGFWPQFFLYGSSSICVSWKYYGGKNLQLHMRKYSDEGSVSGNPRQKHFSVVWCAWGQAETKWERLYPASQLHLLISHWLLETLVSISSDLKFSKVKSPSSFPHHSSSLCPRTCHPDLKLQRYFWCFLSHYLHSGSNTFFQLT